MAAGEFPRWEAALAVVNRDLAVTLPGQGPLQLMAQRSYGGDAAEDVYVALASGEWHGNTLEPGSAGDADAALAAVADAAQDTVTERLWQAWPVCAEHRLGMHLRAEDGGLFWWCAGEPPRQGQAHLRARVGALDTVRRGRRKRDGSARD